MTKDEAIYEFWGSFNMPAYEENSVPSAEPTSIDIPYPYITYEKVADDFGESVSATASVWTRNKSWREADEYADQISNSITRGGIMLPCDDGAVWVKRGSPFCTSTSDPSDNLIKRKLFNIEYEFII